MPQIIGVCGFIGSGKSTVAKIIETRHGYFSISFASVLKDICSALFSWDREMLEGDTETSRMCRDEVDEWWANKLNIPQFSPRFALQHIGTEVLRDHFNENIWLFAAEREIIKHDRVVISDVRFPNEIDMIRSYDGLLLRVVRGPEPDWYETARNDPSKMIEKYPKIHYSEYAWTNTEFDSVINNNDTHTELRHNIISVLQHKGFSYSKWGVDAL